MPSPVPYVVSASAPGKIILFGEHAVVYGHPALAVPVTQVQATVTVSSGSHPGVWIEAPDVGLSAELSSLQSDQPLAAAVHILLSDLGIYSTPPLHIQVTSSIPLAAGLGSGAAVSVAIIRALSIYLARTLPDSRISALAYQVEKLHHGIPSGIDNTVVTYARPVFFVKGQSLQTFHPKTPFTLVIADTGIPAFTKESVNAVHRLWQTDPARWEQVFNEIGGIARLARAEIEHGTWKVLGYLMDRNHALLQQMNVSSTDLDHLVTVARDAGALGAKLSGGGRGGNMISLVDSRQAAAVAQALQSAGAVRTITTTVE